MLIARLAVELHWYIPEELDETWAHLRTWLAPPQLITSATALAQRTGIPVGGLAGGDPGVR